MTITELRDKFNKEFGKDKPWPKIYEVDKETYANVCHGIFDYHLVNHLSIMIPGVGYELSIKVGMNGGIMFKNVELIMT